jgi:hypothetical protein
MNARETLTHSSQVLLSERALANQSLRAASRAERGSTTPFHSLLAATRSVRVRGAWPAGKDRHRRTTAPSRCPHVSREKQKHGPRTVAVRAPSAPGRSVHESRDACPSRPPRSRSASLPEAQSRTQTLEHSANHHRIHTAFEADPYFTRQLDMNRAGPR